jgi:imidazolonepropionase-like amidohydrolase
MFIVGRRLFDGRAPGALEGIGVEVDGARIIGVGPRPPSMSDADVVDLGDVTLLPGLIDIHQHLAFDATVDAVAHLQAVDDGALLEAMRVAARRALAAGITTVRDLGDRNYLSLQLRDEFAQESSGSIGPRILASGPPLTITNGHCWFLGGEADGVDGVRAAVRERVARGVDVIKIMATGGNMTPTVGPHESQYGPAEIAAAAEEAHAHGLKLAVHAHGSQGIVDALAAGADSIEHCTFFTADAVDADPAVIDQLARSGIVISATGANLPTGEGMLPAIRLRRDAIIANHGAMLRAGARMVCSSDAGVAPLKPHDVLPYGVSRFLPMIGMTNAEALSATTATAADACGIGDVTGTLAAGKDADILAVAGNPLEDITAIHDVVAVFARGRRVSGIS